MKVKLASCILLAGCFTGFAQNEVRLLSPENGATIYQPHPHFHWNRLEPDNIEDAYQIQILGENKKVVDDDTFEVISRYVPVKAITPGKYSWRVRKAPDGAWSKERNFELKVPKVYKIAAGSEPTQIEKTILEASQNTPAQVVFEPGEYTWGNDIKLEQVNDLTIDGGGATILYNKNPYRKTASLELRFCANITVRNMKMREYLNPSIMLDVLAVDQAAKTVKIKPKEGERTDLYNVFSSGPNTHGILRFPNLKVPGKSSGEIALGDPKLKLTGPDERGVFTLHNVTRNVKEGMIGTLLKYTSRAFELTRCTNITIANVTLLGSGKGVVGGSDNSALSILSCRFLPYKPGGLLGAQSFITGGEIGFWVENMEKSLSPDDNMAHINARSNLKKINAEGIATVGRVLTLKVGDQVLLWDEKVGEPTVVEIIGAWGNKGQKVPPGLTDDRRAYTLKFDKTAAEINSAMKRPENASFMRVLLFRYNPSNRDFVYRNNKILGGSAGMMYHGNRGLIEGNEIVNCRGIGLQASHLSPNQAAGCGARNVVIKNNTIKNTGKVAIKSISTANIGGNLIIKNNHIIYTLENGSLWNAIQISGASDEVVIKDNTIESELKPEKRNGGVSWIRVDKSGEVELKDNKIISKFTEVQLMRRRK